MAGAVATLRTWGEMIKFAHSLFALPFALLATFLAARPARPRLGQLVLIVLCMVAVRSAAMTFNRIVDRALDARNPRTAGRALPRGTISAGAAWGFYAVTSAAFVGAAALFWPLYGNRWPLALSAPVLALLSGYSFTKRFTRLSHLILGAGIGFAPVAAWIAIDPPTLGTTALGLWLAVTCWIGGFDLIYACQDCEYDRATGLYSVPAKMGIAAALWLARGLHAVTLAALISVGWSAALGVLYYVGVGAAALLLVVENALVSPRDLSRVNLAFFTVNGVVGLLLGALGIADVLLRDPG